MYRRHLRGSYSGEVEARVGTGSLRRLSGEESRICRTCPVVDRSRLDRRQVGCHEVEAAAVELPLQRPDENRTRAVFGFSCPKRFMIYVVVVVVMKLDLVIGSW